MKNISPKIGRPTAPDETALKPYAIRLNAEQRAKVEALGGRKWFREKLDAEPWPAAPTKKPPEGGL